MTELWHSDERQQTMNSQSGEVLGFYNEMVIRGRENYTRNYKMCNRRIISTYKNDYVSPPKYGNTQ